MGKEVRIVEYNNGGGGGGGVGGGGGDDDRVLEWQDGLPGLDDLTPLSQALIPPELAAAFRITAEPERTVVEVNRASNNTISSIRGQFSAFGEANPEYGNNNFKSFGEEEEFVENEDAQMDLNLEGMDSRKVRRIEAVVEESDSVMKTDNNNNNNNYSVSNMSASNDDLGSSKTSKRPRLVWTPQLHKRFVDVVAHLGIKNAVPKTIMQLMNVEGLTRENVASHLQKYRLYLKRMQGLSDEGPSASDHLFASTPVPQSLQESGGGGGGGGSVAGHGNGHNRQPQHQSSGNGHSGMAIPMPYPPPQSQMMHMPFIRMPTHGHGHVGVPPGNGYHGYEAHHPYTMMQNKFVPFPQYHNHVAPSDN